MNSFDIIILSAGGRGVRLANQLAQANKVAFIQVFDDYICEDEEGPFGFFLESVRPSNWVESPSGFSLKTLHKSFHFKEPFLSSVYKNRIEYQNILSTRSRDFQHNWLRELLRQLTTGVDISLSQDKMDEDVSFVFRDFGLLKNISQKFNSNISVFNENDLSFNEKFNSFSNPKIGEIKGKHIVCLLNPEEMRRFGESFYHIFFSKSYVSPYWCWQRLTFELDDEGYPLPLYLVLADPEGIPWTHERLICLKRSLVFENRMEVWVKIPYSSCDFLESIQNITKTLENYFPKFKWTCQSEDWVTPTCLFPVYSKECVNQMSLKPHIHYIWSAEDLSPNECFNREQNILSTFL